MDYAYVQLIGLTSGTTTLFTARMSLSGIAVPGFGLPGIAPGVVFTPFPVLVHPGTIFFGLGDHSGDCFAAGCGNTGWIQASYNLAANDTYRIMFGVNNMGDDPRDPYDSALLFDFGAGAGGVPTVAVTPEPASFVLLGTGLIVVFGFARRKRNQA